MVSVEGPVPPYIFVSYLRAAAPHTCLPRELPLARGTVSHFPIVSKLANCRPPRHKTDLGLR